MRGNNTPNRTCERCGVAFHCKPSRLTRASPVRFCSRQCKDAAVSSAKRVQQTCRGCGQSFTIPRSKLNDGGGRYCSNACANPFRGGNGVKRSGDWRACPGCGTAIWITPSVARKGNHFCGRACYESFVRSRPAADRFWELVNKDGPIVRPDLGPCWLWIGGIGSNGYGRFCTNGKRTQAHRFSWELAHGSVPDDRCVLHKCDVRACVRPDHLWLGTRNENSADMAAKGRSTIGERDPMAILTAEQVRAIRERREGGMTMREAGEPFGATADNVWAIVHRKSWKHLP